jgi:hypothetical protein
MRSDATNRAVGVVIAGLRLVEGEHVCDTVPGPVPDDLQAERVHEVAVGVEESGPAAEGNITP